MVDIFGLAVFLSLGSELFTDKLGGHGHWFIFSVRVFVNICNQGFSRDTISIHCPDIRTNVLMSWAVS